MGIHVGSDRDEPDTMGHLDVHEQDAYYDTAGLLAVADSLGSGERAGLLAALGREDDLSGLSILHVVSHRFRHGDAGAAGRPGDRHRLLRRIAGEGGRHRGTGGRQHRLGRGRVDATVDIGSG